MLPIHKKMHSCYMASVENNLLHSCYIVSGDSTAFCFGLSQPKVVYDMYHVWICITYSNGMYDIDMEIPGFVSCFNAQSVSQGAP